MSAAWTQAPPSKPPREESFTAPRIAFPMPTISATRGRDTWLTKDQSPRPYVDRQRACQSFFAALSLNSRRVKAISSRASSTPVIAVEGRTRLAARCASPPPTSEPLPPGRCSRGMASPRPRARSTTLVRGSRSPRGPDLRPGVVHRKPPQDPPGRTGRSGTEAGPSLTRRDQRAELDPQGSITEDDNAGSRKHPRARSEMRRPTCVYRDLAPAPHRPY